MCLVAVTDQMGTTALHGFERILESLSKNGVRFIDKARDIRSMGLETVKFPEK